MLNRESPATDMSWDKIKGHAAVLEQFRRAVHHGRLASSFLFVGPAGIGKRMFALQLAQALLCEARPGEELEACGCCSACAQVAALAHPDLEIVQKPDDKSFIPLELFIGKDEQRMREGLCHNIALKPFRGGRKVAIIDDADFLHQEGANCLLKTLEEPPPKSVLILIGTSEQKQLPTIRSRCQVVRFRPLPEPLVAELLVTQGLVPDADEARKLAAMSAGSLQQALEMADVELNAFRQMLLQEICQADWDALDLAKSTSEFVDAAGKEAPPRRARMLQLIGFAAEFYRQVMRVSAGLPATGDSLLQSAVAACGMNIRGDGEMLAACWQRCLDAQSHVLANANQATLLECWLDDLAAISRGGSVPLLTAR